MYIVYEYPIKPGIIMYAHVLTVCTLPFHGRDLGMRLTFRAIMSDIHL